MPALPTLVISLSPADWLSLLIQCIPSRPKWHSQPQIYKPFHFSLPLSWLLMMMLINDDDGDIDIDDDDNDDNDGDD